MTGDTRRSLVEARIGARIDMKQDPAPMRLPDLVVTTCAGLCADLYRRVKNLNRYEENGVCTPARISAFGGFTDVHARRLGVASDGMDQLSALPRRHR